MDEYLEEISRSLANRYMQANANSVDKLATKQKNHGDADGELQRKKFNRFDGQKLVNKKATGKAKVRFTGEEFELEETIMPAEKIIARHPEHKKAYVSSYGEGKFKSSDRHGKVKFWNELGKASAHKHAGVELKEGTQLDELSDKTLRSYIDKAKDQVQGHLDWANKRKNPKSVPLSKTVHKRISGINNARAGLMYNAMKEEGAQLDELSQNTLTRYIYKAKSDIRNHSTIYGTSKKRQRVNQKRRDGVSRAVDKRDSIHELSQPTLTRYIIKASSNKAIQRKTIADAQTTGDYEPRTGNYYAKQGAVAKAAKAYHKIQNRNHGVNKAMKKLDPMVGGVHESEQIAELSKKTLGKYIKAAAGDMSDHSVDQNRLHRSANKAARANDIEKADHHDELADKAGHKIGNREVGIKRAVKRLTKESQVSEMTSDRIRRYFDNAATSRYHAEKKGDDKTVGKRDRGLDSAFKKLTSVTEIKE